MAAEIPAPSQGENFWKVWARTESDTSEAELLLVSSQVDRWKGE